MNKLYKINELTYELIENYKDGFSYEEVLNKATDYFNDFDYIVGDWGYGQLSYKRENNRNASCGRLGKGALYQLL